MTRIRLAVRRTDTSILLIGAKMPNRLNGQPVHCKHEEEQKLLYDVNTNWSKIIDTFQTQTQLYSCLFLYRHS
jgi:hypothetical protein